MEADYWDQIEFLFHRGYWFKGNNHNRQIIAHRGTFSAPLDVVYHHEREMAKNSLK
jgi:hypothetical protein